MKLSTIASIVLMASMLGSVAHAADAKENYEKKCAKCHGSDGDGKGRAGRGLKKKENLAFKDKAVMAKFTDEELFKFTKEGGDGTKVSKEMEAYGSYTDAEIKALVEYIKTFAK